MTITVTNYRNNGEECPAVTFQKSVVAALVHLVAYEYDYGGTPVVVEPTKVQVNTSLMGCHDRTVFERTEEKMRPLVEVSLHIASTMTKEASSALAAAVAPRLQEVTGGNPGLVIAMAGMMMGNPRARIATLLWCEGTNPSQEALDLVKKLKLEDLIPAALLAKENGQSLVSICQQLGMA